MLGAAFALLSAVAFSLNAVLVRRGVVLASASQAAFVTVLMGVPMFLLAAIVTGQAFRAGDLPGARYAYLAAGGVINFVVGRQFNYKAINAIGAARAAPFQALTLPYSVLIAFLFLDESVTIGVGAGVALIMIGPAIMVERPARQPAAVTAPAAARRGADWLHDPSSGGDSFGAECRREPGPEGDSLGAEYGRAVCLTPGRGLRVGDPRLRRLRHEPDPLPGGAGGLDRHLGLPPASSPTSRPRACSSRSPSCRRSAT